MIILLLSGGVPFLSLPAGRLRIPQWLGEPDPFWYGVMALILIYGAYMAEVYRAGIEAVPRGQMEAARSLGMSHGQAMRHIIVPQAVTQGPGPLLNDLVALMKDTALVSVIALIEAVLVGREILAELNSSALTLDRLLLPDHHDCRWRALGRPPDQAKQGKITRGAQMRSREAEPMVKPGGRSTSATASWTC